MKCKLAMILFLLCPFTLNAADQVTFRLNLVPNTSYIYTTDISQTRTQTVEGEKQSLGQEMLMVWGVDVLGHQKSGDMDLKLTYTRVKIEQSFDDQKIEFDSDSPPATLDPSMKGLATMPGSVINVRLNPAGKVTRMDGVEAMLDKMIKAMDIPDSVQKQGIIADLRKQWGADAMKQSVEQIASFYPDKPVSIGDAWMSTVELSSGVPMRIVSEYTLKSRDNGRDSIDVSSQITSDSTSSIVSMGSLKMAYNIKGTQTGAIIADEATGLPQQSKLDMHYDGSVTVSGVPDQEPQTWPISADGSVTMTIARQ